MEQVLDYLKKQKYKIWNNSSSTCDDNWRSR